MIPGSTRYARGLGFVGTDPNAFERVTGLNVTGDLKTEGGSGVFVDVAPTTMLSLILGAAIGTAWKKSVSGALLGALAGAMTGTGLHAAGHAGV